MAWRGDPVWLADVLREAGLEVIEMPGWKQRGHGDFGEIWGSMYHHTGSNNTSAEFCRDGRPDLPGPICNVHVGRRGQMTLVAAGIAYHGGSGSYMDIGHNIANQRTIGFEVQYDGKDITNAQREAMVVAMAAISRKLNRGANNSVVGHREYSNMGKWDPGNVDMNVTREQVRKQIAAGPGKVVSGKPKPAAHSKSTWTLSGSEYYGPLSGPDDSISGLYGEPAHKMRSLRVFQEAVGIPVTGIYDARTREAAQRIQREHKIYGWGQVSKATFFAALKEQDMAKTLETVFGSRVADSTWKGPLWEHIVNGNAHAYNAQENTAELLKRLDEVESKVDKLIAALEAK